MDKSQPQQGVDVGDNDEDIQINLIPKYKLKNY